MFISTPPGVFFKKNALQIQSKPIGEQPRRSSILTKLLCSFIEITPTHGCIYIYTYIRICIYEKHDVFKAYFHCKIYLKFRINFGLKIDLEKQMAKVYHDIGTLSIFDQRTGLD